MISGLVKDPLIKLTQQMFIYVLNVALDSVRSICGSISNKIISDIKCSFFLISNLKSFNLDDDSKRSIRFDIKPHGAILCVHELFPESKNVPVINPMT